MSRLDKAEDAADQQESRYLKVDLRYFFVVAFLLAALLVALALWDNKTGILATVTTNLLDFLKIQF